MRVDELRDALRREADELGGTEPTVPQARSAAVAERVRVGSARRSSARLAGVAVAAMLTVAGFVLGPTLVPRPAREPFGPEEPMVVHGQPRLAGFPMPAKLKVGNAEYSYWRSEEVDQSRQILRVAVAPSNHRQVFAWATSFGSLGRAVVSVDGVVVDRSHTGSFEYGVRLAPAATHLIVVRVTDPQPGKKIGLALYGPVTF